MGGALRRHWPEYLIEAWALGTFMVSAAVFTTLFEYPGSPLHRAIPDAGLRRALIGIAMGLTAIGLIQSPWGRRSGAHMNPAVTLAFWRLGKVAGIDALSYVIAQCVGGVVGVLLAGVLLRGAFMDEPVRFVATVPGASGMGLALAAELGISALMMWTILQLSSSRRLASSTAYVAGTLVAVFIAFEAPLSGMSMNPARSLASALPSGIWTGFWIYLVAPVLGMQLAAAAFQRWRGRPGVACAKLLHTDSQRCIHCGYQPPAQPTLDNLPSGELQP
jgi:aquaporin Z